MEPKRLSSLQNPLIQHLIHLRKDRQYREKEGRVLISGKKMVQEFPFPIHELISIEPFLEKEAKEHILVSDSLLKKITNLEEPDGVAAVVDLPKPQNLEGKNHLLILDGIQDPGNLGTLIRTALAFQWDGVIVTEETVDLFNDKALRAAKGATFLLPYQRRERETLSPFLQEKEIYLSDLEGVPLEELKAKPPLALILNQEGKGPSQWAKKIGKQVKIATSAQVESLNVASAGAIFLYHLKPLAIS